MVGGPAEQTVGLLWGVFGYQVLESFLDGAGVVGFCNPVKLFQLQVKPFAVGLLALKAVPDPTPVGPCTSDYFCSVLFRWDVHKQDHL